MTFAASKLDPRLLSRALLYELSVLGVMLILWEAVTYATRLTQRIRSRSNRGALHSHRHQQGHFL